MKKDTDLIIHHFEHEIKVTPIADIHFGAINCNEKAWDNFCQNVLSDPYWYLMLDGDLINNALKSSKSNSYEDIMRPREQKERMAKKLKPLTERILNAVPGNHEGRSGKDADDDPMYDIMCKLNLEDLYRENMAFVKIGIGKQNGDSRKGRFGTTYIFGAVHGTGNGGTTGGAVNKNERFASVIEGLDCLVVGHTHKGAVTRPSKMVIDNNNNKIVMRETLVVSTESWMEYGSYALRMMLTPASTCRPQQLILKQIDRHEPKYIEVRW
jgi:UDP-2,3-diacylglucosamine pyrophosphatase LpxH